MLMPVLEVVAWTLGGITALAAAVKGVPVVWRGLSRMVHAVDAILDLAAPEGWPNGSQTMKESHHALYTKVERVEADLVELHHLLTGGPPGRHGSPRPRRDPDTGPTRSDP